MDGKAEAEQLIAKAIKNPELMRALAAAPKPEEPAGS
jgi:predicted component of type VI protein secretion system